MRVFFWIDPHAIPLSIRYDLRALASLPSLLCQSHDDRNEGVIEIDIALHVTHCNYVKFAHMRMYMCQW